MNDTDAPEVAERYLTATQSSNLRCETRDDAPVGAAGLLIAAGWSASRVGAALLRLHTKVDRTGLEQVHAQLAIQATRWKIERPEAVAASVLAWWLNRLCSACHGRKFELVKDTPVLSAKLCKPCRGSGETALPGGESGKRLAEWLDNCKVHAVASIKKRLRPAQ